MQDRLTNQTKTFTRHTRFPSFKGRDEANLVKDSSIFFAASIVSHFLNYIFHLYLSRTLGPSGYGVFNSLISIYLIVALPFSAVQTAIAMYVSGYRAEGNLQSVRRLLRFSLIRISIFALFFCVVYLLLIGTIASLLRIDDNGPIIVAGMTIVASLFLPIFWGVLQGLQRFYFLGLSLISYSLSRLIFCVILIRAGYGISAAFASFLMGNLLAGGLCAVALIFIWKGWDVAEGEPAKPEGLYRYAGPVLISILTYTLLTNLDVLMVKHYFPPVEAGHYAAVALIARAFVFLPFTFATVMFPKVTELHFRKENPISLMNKTLLMGFFFCVIGFLICLIYPEIIILLLFGDQYRPVLPVLRIIGLGITPFSMLQVLVFYNLARQSMAFIYTLLAGLVLYATLLSLFHNSLIQVVMMMGIIGSTLFVLNYAMLMKGRRGLSPGP